MRIAAVSVAPLFPDYVVGGSQKILTDIAGGLKLSGHDIRIWCTGTDRHDGTFELEGVPVHPELRLRGTFPATHQVSPTALARTADMLRTATDWADRVYLHADAVYLRHALEGAAIVRSIHDFTYEEALLSALTLPADATIVPSDYLKRCIEVTVALLGKNTVEPVVAIPNGIPLPETAPEPVLPPGIEPRGENDLVLLFPHRPEPTKGVREAMQTAVEVQRLEPTRNARLLMPAYPAGIELDDATGSAQEIWQVARSVGAEELVELHGWLGPADMPGYYAAGDVTLCIGSFIESFGLVPVESVVNGTPAVCSRVGALRDFAPIDGITLVPYGQISTAADATQAAVAHAGEDTGHTPSRNKAGTAQKALAAGRVQIASRFSFDLMISRYESVITGPLAARRSVRVDNAGWLELTPWCDIQGDHIYDDYAASSHPLTQVISALEAGRGRIKAESIMATGNTGLAGEIEEARSTGILVPRFVIE